MEHLDSLSSGSSVEEIGTGWNRFHADHVQDLIKSGLTIATVQALGLYTIPPSQIAHHLGFDNPQIASVLCFRYPTVPGFCRDKIFPPLKDKDGHTVRYLQRKDSGVHLYIPPLAQCVLSDPTVPLYISEGEKKAAKACQENLPCLGLGGLWCWVQDGKPIRDLDRVVWQERQVILVPDSDVWPARHDLLQAVYGLGTELERRGAYVRVLKIV